MSKNTRSLFAIADHVTPKIDEVGVAFTLNSRDYKMPQAVAIENHPADSRVRISSDGMVQTLSSRMGTGGAMCRWLWRTIWKNTLCVGLRR